MGQQLGFQMGQLSRQIAGLFTPEIQRATRFVQSLVDWMRSLTDTQRANIVRWLEAGAAAAIVAMVLPRVVSGVMAATTAIRALGLAIASGLSATGIGALLPLIGAIVSVVTALVVGTEAGRGALGRFFSFLSDVAAGFGRVFGPILTGIVGLVNRLTDAFDSTAGAVSDAFSGILDAFAPLGHALGTILDLIGAIAAPLLQIVVLIGSGIANALRPVIYLLSKVVDIVVTILEPAFRGLGLVIEGIAKAIAFITGQKIDLPKHVKPETPSRGGVAQAVGGMTSPESIYAQIAQASVQIGKSAQERQLDESRKQTQLLERIKAALGDNRKLAQEVS